MSKKNYRIVEYDPANDIWVLQKKHFFLFWIGVSAGSKQKLEKFIEGLDNGKIQTA